jgi:hypothetical protein
LFRPVPALPTARELIREMVKAQAWLILGTMSWACAVYVPPDLSARGGAGGAGRAGVGGASGSTGSVSIAGGGNGGVAGAVGLAGRAGDDAGGRGGAPQGGDAAAPGVGGAIVGEEGGNAGAAGRDAVSDAGARGEPVGGNAGAGGDASGCTSQQARLVASADATIDAAKPNTNVGSVTQLSVAADGAGASQRVLLRFDLSSIPSNAKLLSAALELQVSASSGGDKLLELHRVQQAPVRPWSEPQATWNKYVTGNPWSNLGGDFGAVTASKPVSAAVAPGSVLDFDVALDVGSFLASPATNFGWLLKASQEPAGGSGESVSFAARENATVGARPALVIQYCP